MKARETAGPPAPQPPPANRGGAWVAAQSILMSALVAAGPLAPGSWHDPRGVLLGAALFAGAGALGIAGVIHLGDNRTPYPAPRPGSRLVRTGVYGFCRHPLYSSVLLAGFAWTLLWQSAPTLALALAQVPFFAAKARAEERRLGQIFPEYPAYAREVPRFVPHPWRRTGAKP